MRYVKMLDQYGCCLGRLESGEGKAESRKGGGSTFFLRLLLSLLIFAGFLWGRLEGREIFGYSARQAAQVIGRNAEIFSYGHGDIGQ